MKTGILYSVTALLLDWSQRDENGNFVFSDSSVVLRYNPGNRMLEYYNYENYGSDGPKTALLDGYQISCNFMTNDASLQTDVYLADIGGSGNEMVYYFDYAVNGLPVYLSESIQQEIGMKHAIEVTVSNNSVKKYRRYAVNYQASETKDAKLDVQFIDALDSANRLYQETGCWSTITMKITAVTARKQPFWMAIRSAAIL